jgi:hypothetical protein
MYAISIIMKSGLTQTFYFKTFKNPDEYYKKLKNYFSDPNLSISFSIEDDFESKSEFLINGIEGVSFTDIEKDLDRQGDLKISQEKANLRMLDKARNDAGLKMLQSTQQNLTPPPLIHKAG